MRCGYYVGGEHRSSSLHSFRFMETTIWSGNENCGELYSNFWHIALPSLKDKTLCRCSGVLRNVISTGNSINMLVLMSYLQSKERGLEGNKPQCSKLEQNDKTSQSDIHNFDVDSMELFNACRVIIKSNKAHIEHFIQSPKNIQLRPQSLM